MKMRHILGSFALATTLISGPAFAQDDFSAVYVMSDNLGDMGFNDNAAAGFSRVEEEGVKTRLLQASPTDLIKRTHAIGGPVGYFATELLQSLVTTFHPGSVMAPKFMPLNDPVASLVAAQPELAQTQPARVDVVTQLDCDRTLLCFRRCADAPRKSRHIENGDYLPWQSNPAS